MTLTPLDAMFVGMAVMKTFQAAVDALPAPKKDGAYSFVYHFLREEENTLAALFERRYGLTLPVSSADAKTPAAPEQH